MKRRDNLNQLRDMSDEDLKNEYARLKESLFKLRFKLSLGEIDAVKSLRREKKALARLQTILRQRSFEEAAQ
jgi:large subunit ribosomal protein L29